DSSELVTFDSAFDARTPSGSGTEVVLDRAGRVTRHLACRGTRLERGETAVQGIGRKSELLEALEVGDRPRLSERVDIDARRTRGTTVVGGGPELLRDGVQHITQKR